MKNYHVTFELTDLAIDRIFIDNEALEKLGIYHDINCDRITAHSLFDSIMRFRASVLNHLNKNGFYPIVDGEDIYVFDDIDRYVRAREAQLPVGAKYLLSYFKSEEAI